MGEEKRREDEKGREGEEEDKKGEGTGKDSQTVSLLFAMCCLYDKG